MVCVYVMMKWICEQWECEAAARGTTAESMSYAAIRIVGVMWVVIECGILESDVVVMVVWGYYLVWILMWNVMVWELVYSGAAEALRAIRERYSGVVVGLIMNGFGSVVGVGLGEFFDFEIFVEVLIDEYMVYGEMARKSNAYSFQFAMGIAIADYGYLGDVDLWMYVGDDVLNDCYCVKQFDFKMVYVCDLMMKLYESGGGAFYAEKSFRGGVEVNSDVVVDGVILYVCEFFEFFD